MRGGAEIPFPYRSHANDYHDHFARTLGHALLSKWRSFKVKRNPGEICISPLKSPDIRPLGPEDIPLIFLTRNSLRFLRSFLLHYRTLGVTRFLCIDDRSTDGTREFLLEESDVDLFGSDIRYREANGGRSWREAIVQLYGTNRWYLNVDCDEYFIYHQYETKRLPQFIAGLEAAGITHCPAPMIDCYPGDAITSAVFDGSSDVMPWEIANMFDVEGYRLLRTGSGMIMSGGPRARVLNNPDIHDELMKYPLVYVEGEITFGVSIHKPWPFTRNFSPIMGSLLHFKFFDQTEKLVREAIADNQYYRGSRSYKNMLEAIKKGQLDYLRSEISNEFRNSQQLAELGFFKTVF
ncbi:glycosyltransferase family 2 protein [Phyllobacterium salinisoli]|nr:glycosyltransferase family 2 protein [Phyllobacterium salinisoli]